MTPQQERIKQAERHERGAKNARLVRTNGPAEYRRPDHPLRKMIRYRTRVARQNRRAHERNSH